MGVLDKNGQRITQGSRVRYYDSTTMWLTGVVADVGGALAILTPENPILLYDFTSGHQENYIYNGEPIPELEIMS